MPGLLRPRHIPTLPIPAVRHSRRGGQLRGQAPAELRLLGAVPHPNVLGRQPQHLRDRRPRIGPVPHQRLGPPRLPRRPISLKNTPNPNKRTMSLWGVLNEYRPPGQTSWSKALMRHGADARAALAEGLGVTAENIRVRYCHE